MNKLFNFIPILLIAFILCACDNENSEQPEQDPAGPAEMGERIEAFGLDLYAETHKRTTDKLNICVSPLSVSTALSMAYNGSAGKTQDDMAATLYVQDISLDSMNAGYQLLQTQLEPLDNKVTFQSFNASYWDERRVELFQDYIDQIVYAFDTRTQKLDFTKEQASLDIMNTWVEEHTNDKIKDLLKVIKPSDALFLINALYFKGDWDNPFDEGWTYDELFTREDGSQVMVPFMHHDATFAFYRGSDYEAVELPFGESGYSMTFLLPNNPTNFDGFIEGLSPALLHELYTDRLKTERLMLKIPKFKIEYEIELKEVLSALGMEIAFLKFQADFSKIGNAFGQNLFIDRVIHKTYLEVDEHGVEGAAATAVVVGVTSLPPMINLDRPFIYVIRHQDTNTPLFIGHVGDPSEAS